MSEEIKMDRKVFETLSSETRINVLKCLDDRRKTITELSSELGLAKSSLHEHLVKMVEVGLVKRYEDGHKWIYYSLTRNGKDILHPHEKTKILLLLSTSLIAIAGGVSQTLTIRSGFESSSFESLKEVAPRAMAATEGADMAMAQETAETVTTIQYSDFILPFLLVIVGLLLLSFGWKRWKKYGKK